MPEKNIGYVTDFFAKPVVAGIKLDGSLSIGDSIHIIGRTTNMVIVVDSMQIDSTNITNPGWKTQQDYVN